MTASFHEYDMNSFVHHSTPVTRKNSSFPHHSNSAGTPLPYIPRRGSHRSVNSAQSLFASREESMPTPIPLMPEPPFAKINPQESDEGSSSSLDSPLQFNPGKEKPFPAHKPSPVSPLKPMKLKSPVHKPRLTALQFSQSLGVSSEPIHNANNQLSRSSTNGNPQSSPRKDRDPHISLDLTDSQTWSLSESFSNLAMPSSAEPQLHRKKAKEPLKSSLKFRRPTARGDLSVITDGGFASSRSEPSTPSHSRSKSVQFAAQLEKVKLFLAEQKPLAVSRDGSPTDDTSGTESDFPPFIYGVPDENRKKKNLVMEVVNMPQRGSALADVMLEDLSLSQDATIHGHVKVRNLAFQKSIAVRFTFDGWQTISEVSAKFEQSLNAGTFDRFSFIVGIADIFSRIENKTLLLAVRYSANGLEIWDNNGGENYQFKFSDPKSKQEPARPELQEYWETSDADAFTFDSHTPLSSRYDFSVSMKKPWKPTEFPLSQPPISHMRMSTYPISNSRDAQWYQKRAFSNPASRRAHLTRGSPRIDNDEYMSSTPIIQDEDVDVVDDDQISVQSFRGLGNRDHQGGHLDCISPKLNSRQSPVGAIFNPETTQRYDSSPPPTALEDRRITSDSSVRESSDEPTPSVTSTSDSQSPLQLPSPLPDESAATEISQRSLEINPEEDMSLFLDRFCFYTGPGSPWDISDDNLQRSHSASSIEQFLYSSPPQFSPPSIQYYTSIHNHRSPSFTLRSRSSSCDDVAVLGGSSTPTPGDTSRFMPTLAV